MSLETYFLGDASSGQQGSVCFSGFGKALWEDHTSWTETLGPTRPDLGSHKKEGDAMVTGARHSHFVCSGLQVIDIHSNYSWQSGD